MAPQGDGGANTFVSPLGPANVAAHPAACNSELSPRCRLHPCSSPPDQRLLRERLRAASTTVVGSFSKKLPCCSGVRTSATTAAVLAWAGWAAESPSSGWSEEAVSAGDAEVKEVPAAALLLVGLVFGWLPPPGSPCKRAPLPQRPCAP